MDESFIGSNLLNLIDLSAQIEPIFAIFSPNLSRYIHIAYNL